MLMRDIKDLGCTLDYLSVKVFEAGIFYGIHMAYQLPLPKLLILNDIFC